MSTLRKQLLALISLLLLIGGWLPAQTSQGLPSKAEIQKEMEAVQQGKGAATQKAEAKRLYEKALKNLAEAESLIGRAAEFKREVSGAVQKAKSLDAEIRAGAKKVVVGPPEGATVETLRLRTNHAESARREVEKTLGSYESIKDGYGSRIQEIQKRLPTIKALIADGSRGLGEKVTQAGIVERASRLAAECELEMLRREEEELTAERSALEGRLGLLPKERSVVILELETAREVEKAWQQLTKNAIEEASKKSAEQAEMLNRQALVARFDDLQLIATQIVKWPKERLGLATEIGDLRDDHRATRTRRTRIQRRFESLHQMIVEVGLNNSTVELIRSEADALPPIKKLQQRSTTAQTRIAEVLLEEYNVERVLEGGSTQKARIRALVERHKAEVSGLDVLMLPVVVESLVKQQDKEAQDISKDLTTLRKRLWDLNRELDLLIETTIHFAAYLEERILWVPSIPRDRLFNTSGLAAAASWAFDPGNWYDAMSGAASEFAAQWSKHFVPFLIALALFLLTPYLGRRLIALGHKVNRPRDDRYFLTWQAVAITFVLGLPFPLLALGMESVLLDSSTKGSFGLGIASALQNLNTFLLMLCVTIQALRPGGLCEIHFRWASDGVAELQKTIRRFLWIVLPFFIFSGVLTYSGRVEWMDSLGRVLFCLAAAIYSFLLFQAIRPKGKLLGTYMQRSKDRWFSKNSYVWYFALSGAPILFIVLAILGYFLSARRLARSFHSSLWAGVLIIAAFCLAQRWIRLSVKKAGIRSADRRMAEIEAQEELGEEVELGQSDFEKLDLEAVRSKTSQLFRAMAVLAFLIAIFSIWSDVLPALKMFERVQLLPTPAILERTVPEELNLRMDDEVAQPSESSDKPANRPSISPVPMPSTGSTRPATSGPETNLPTLTLSQLLLFLISMGFTVLGVRNLPTLVEIVALRRMRMDEGARVAYKTIVQYLVLAIGIVSMAGALNIHWSDLQWLVAALTFGLAFGLQEIFANFISGLILLFERPIRVGNIVTIGQVNGRVSTVRLRATVIRDFDKKELLVPNKEFITKSLINWTLSDTVVRLKLPIAVTLDADVARVRSILEEVAAEGEDTLDEPPPRVLLTSIDDGVVRFEIWLFTNDRTNRPGLKDQMFRTIRARFDDEGIRFAKPQQDLFLHSKPKGETEEG
jgi:potassium-dependent mechanosensitive channel